MLGKLFNVFRIPELRNKLLFTLAMLCVYRIGFYVPLPGVDAPTLIARMNSGSAGAWGTLANYMSVFSGGALGQSTVFSLGIMPYISASIIIQLMGTVVPSLEKLKKEGEPGMRKINEWTRYLTVAVCLIQSLIYVKQIVGGDLLYSVVKDHYVQWFCVMAVIVLTCASMFLMWLGEQIDQYGIGNGVSLIITAGILARMYDSIGYVYKKTSLSMVVPDNKIGPGTVLFLVCCFIFVVAGSIYLTEAQRRIRVQQAKHTRGRRVYGGNTTYLPLRVNHAGVMPIIFASSLMIFPVMGLEALTGSMTTATAHSWWGAPLIFLEQGSNLGYGGYLYEVLYCIMIFFFSYFWNTVQFQPKEMADQLRDYGSFVPGLRPGKRTAEYLEAVMNRITYVGAGFLCVIAVVPSITGTFLLGGSNPQDFQATQFLGGTGLLIVISVILDLVNRIEANLVMRNYSGFMDSGSGGGGGGGSGAKIRRPKGSPKRGPTQPQTAAYDSAKPKGLPA